MGVASAELQKDYQSWFQGLGHSCPCHGDKGNAFFKINTTSETHQVGSRATSIPIEDLSLCSGSEVLHRQNGRLLLIVKPADRIDAFKTICVTVMQARQVVPWNRRICMSDNDGNSLIHAYAGQRIRMSHSSISRLPAPWHLPKTVGANGPTQLIEESISYRFGGSVTLLHI